MISPKRKTRIKEIEGSISRAAVLLKKLERKSLIAGGYRLSIFVLGSILFFIPYFYSLKIFAFIDLIVFSGLFVFVSIIHNKIIERIRSCEKWIELKKSCLARIKLDWKNIQQSNFKENENSRPIETDLDIIGENSLHQLLNFSKSKGGSSLLREYLTNIPKSIGEISRRQETVKELVGLSHFRDKFILTSSLSIKKEFDSGMIMKWISKSESPSRIFRLFFLLSAIAIINLVFISLSFYGYVPKIYMITSFIYISLNFFFYKYIKSFPLEADIMNDELKKIIGVLSFMENYNFGHRKNLSELCSVLRNKDTSPSKQLKQINLVLTFLSFSHNPFLWFAIVLIFPAEFYMAYKIAKAKSGLRKNLDSWLESWHQMECFVSIANYAYLNPDYTFPIFENTDSSELKMQVKELGHPLISHERNVKNDFDINGSGEIFLITGSNMSGKSTFLRTIGINLCLAYSGAPVNASYFASRLMRIFTCIKVSDSVIDGISYFYAEVKRLKELLDEIQTENIIPLLFLIDEIFKGTNNIERNVGGKAMLKSLADKNGSGFVSTHDLELVKLADVNKAITNYHFRENVENSEMIFDYKLHIGPCPTTNALKIMKSAGLPID